MEIDLNEQAEGAVMLEGHEDAIVGIVEEFGNGPRILYSKSKIIQKLCTMDGMTVDDAHEYYEFNILGLHAGEQNVVFLETEISPILTGEGYKYTTK